MPANLIQYPTIRAEAAFAIYAAHAGRKQWSTRMAYLYCKRRNCLKLYRLACQLESAQKVGF